MKDQQPPSLASGSDGPDDAADELGLDADDVELSENATPASTSSRSRSIPPPLTPQEAAASFRATTVDDARPAEPSLDPTPLPEAPPNKLIYGLIVLGAVVVSGTGGALWVRRSAAEPRAATSVSVPSSSSLPKVITINPVDMSGAEAP